jgi:1-acyl-sn-glycerol-3-phosphate acyltransferase
VLAISRVRVHVRGLEHLQSGQHYVFAGNHLSLMDTPVVLGHIPRQILFLVNERFVRLPFLGTHLRRAGHFSVDSNDAKASLKVMTQAARAIQARGASVVVFPEGRRAAAGLQDFKEGVAYIAIKSGVPLIPFAVRGTREVLPIGGFHIRGGDVDLVFGEPISTAGWSLKEREEFTTLARSRVEALLDQTQQREQALT